MDIVGVVVVLCAIVALALMWRAVNNAPMCQCGKADCGGGCLGKDG